VAAPGLAHRTPANSAGGLPAARVLARDRFVGIGWNKARMLRRAFVAAIRAVSI